MLRYSFFTALFLIGLHALAQKAITLEDIFLKNTFGESSVRGLNWMKDGQYYSAQENGYIIRYAVQSGQPLDTLFAAVDDFEFSGYSFSEDEKQILLMTDREPIYRRSFTAEYYVYDMASGSLRLIHGSGDDNVHIQNTYALQDALIESGKHFRSFIYPDRNHGIRGGKIRLHVFEMISDFILEQK